MRLYEYIKLIRVNQWYKNLVVFLPLFFVGNFFDLGKFIAVVIGFFVLCFISSANYVINDIFDIKKDRLHPEKKNRPLASRKVSYLEAFLLFFILFFIAIFTAANMPVYFLYAVISLFIINQFYSFVFRNEIFLDIIFISINFVIRAVSGTFLINSDISPWLILCTFFLALFLAVGKRRADIISFKEDSYNHRKVMKYYNKEITTFLLIISTNLLVVSYALYSFLSQYKNLIFTLPIALYVILRYLYLINKGSVIARNPERVFTDLRMLVGILLWVFLVFVLIYY
jgi:4-hydroxybenzoate polyprenyltransferase